MSQSRRKLNCQLKNLPQSLAALFSKPNISDYLSHCNSSIDDTVDIIYILRYTIHNMLYNYLKKQPTRYYITDISGSTTFFGILDISYSSFIRHTRYPENDFIIIKYMQIVFYDGHACIYKNHSCVNVIHYYEPDFFNLVTHICYDLLPTKYKIPWEDLTHEYNYD